MSLFKSCCVTYSDRRRESLRERRSAVRYSAVQCGTEQYSKTDTVRLPSSGADHLGAFLLHDSELSTRAYYNTSVWCYR